MIKWRYTTGERESAGRGLASDEFLMNQYSSWAASECPEPSLRVYTFRNHCALIGRFQNVEAEVDLDECKSLGVEVNRRVTGGGAILVGEDQIIISVASSVDHPIVPSHPARILPKLARGIIAGLEGLGIRAEYRPKNDIVANGRKIAGTAICVEESGALLYQASVLLDFDVRLMLRTLKIPREKISDKGIASAAERMTTIRQETGKRIEMSQAREAIVRGFERTFRMTAVLTPFTREELAQIQRLEIEKYASDTWINQRIPGLDAVGICEKKTPAGLIRVYVTLASDKMKSVLITGDFISGKRAINDIEAALKWGRTDRPAIQRAILVAAADSEYPIQGLEPSELAEIIYQAARSARRDLHPPPLSGPLSPDA